MGLAKGHMDPQWLKAELSKPGRSQADLAKHLDYDPSKVNRMCSGQRQVKAWEADKIREYLALTGAPNSVAPAPNHAAGATVGRGTQPKVIASLLPVRGIVEAGSWREVAYQEFMEPEYIPVAPAIIEPESFVLKVQGPSMDLHYPPGGYVLVRPWYGGAPPVGKHVVIERERSGLVETTLKELTRSPEGKLELWPKSRHPGYQAAVQYDDHEDSTVRILGVVIWAISPVG